MTDTLKDDLLCVLDEYAARYKSFYDFCREDMFGRHGILDKRNLSKCHKELCQQLGEMKTVKGQRTRMKLWPRGSLKTSVCGIAYPLWRMINNPDIRILITSATEKLSGKILESIKQVLESQAFKESYGDLVGRTSKWRGKEIVIASRKNRTIKDPTVAVASVETSEIGGHWDLVICDDLHDDKNVTSREAIEKVKKHYGLIGPLLDPTHGEMEVIGTRWDEADVYAHIESLIPAANVSIKKAISDDGVNLFPEVYTPDFLDDMKRKMGSYLFSLNYMNTPTSPEDMVFKQEWLKACIWDAPAFPPMQAYYMSIDPAISEKRDSDYTAIIVAGVDADDNWYIVDAMNARLSPTETIEAIFRLAKQWSPYKVGIEVVSYQKILKNWVEREMAHRRQYFMIEELKPGQRSKVKRIEGLMPRIEFKALRWRASLDLITDQFKRHRPDREQAHDDMIDAIAYLADLVPPAVRTNKVSTHSYENGRKVVWPKERMSRDWYSGSFNQYRRVGA